MRFLVVNGFDSTEHPVVRRVVDVLESGGHTVSTVTTERDGFDRPMSTEERLVYHEEGRNIVSPEVRDSVALVRDCEAMVFCYPTIADNPPHPVKNWLDRVLLLGVAFRFNSREKVRPGLTHVRRLGVVTTVVDSGERAGETGRRTILRTLRFNCALTCRRRFVALRAEHPDLARIDRELGSW